MGGSMSPEIRSQGKCYYASEAYSESFWGKFGYLYEGKGRLRLSTDGLSLEIGLGELSIPFDSIKGIGLGRFSSWSKPFGLDYLIVRYHQQDDLRTIHLIPFESAFDPTWTTSELVWSWYKTLGQIDELAGRIEPPQFEPPTQPTKVLFRMLAAGIVAFSFGAFFLGWLLIHQ
jgi:hypothetical protein